MKVNLIQAEADKFLTELRGYIKALGLENLLAAPIDHLAIKLKDGDDYDRFVLEIEPDVDKLFYTIIGNRRLGGAVLKQQIHFGELGATDQVEIMEPKPGKAGKDFVGFEHIELLHKDLRLLAKQLKDQKIEFEDRRDSCGSLILRINDKGQEIKFRTQPLHEKALEEYEEGTAIRLKW